MKIFILNNNLQLYRQQQIELFQADYRVVTLELLRLNKQESFCITKFQLDVQLF